MATHDYVIANQSGSAFRADLNDALGAIVTQNSSSTEPATRYAYQYWVDTSVNPALVKQRNAANNAWVTLWEVDGQQLLRDGTTNKPAISFTSDTNTGLYRAAENELGIITGGNEAVRVSSSSNVGVGTPSPNAPLHVKKSAIGLIQTWEADLGTNERTCNLFSPESDSQTEPFIFSTSNSWRFRVDATEALTIDSLGHVGIGLTNPSDYLTNARDLVVGDISDGIDHGITVACGSTYAGRICFADGTDTTSEQRGMLVYVHTDDRMEFHVEGTEVGRFDGDDFFVGDFSGGSSVGGAVKAKGFNTRTGPVGAFGGHVFNINWTGSAAQLYINTSNVGSISLSSDYRIKKNIELITVNCIDRIKQLRPIQYQLRDYGIHVADGVTREGFIAHEVADVIPSGCEGEKDAENQTQSLRLDAILSVTVKALQEAVAKIETLEASVAALEARLTALENV